MGDIFIEQEIAEKILPFKVEFNRPDLRLEVYPTETLPFQERIDREMRRKMLEFTGVSIPEAERFFSTPYELFSGFSLDYYSSIEYSEEEEGSHYYTLYGNFEALYGDVNIRYSGRSGAGAERPMAKWAYRRPGGELLTEAVAGDQFTPALRLISGPGEMTGVSVTNYPLRGPESRHSHTFTGPLQPGWEVELYRDDILIGYYAWDRTGRYVFENVPLPYGHHTFRLVFYGPQGRRREELESFYIDDTLVDPGDTRYRAGLFTDSELSLSDYLKIFAQAERRFSPFAGLTVSASGHREGADFQRELENAFFSAEGSLSLGWLILQPVLATDLSDTAYGLSGSFLRDDMRLHAKLNRFNGLLTPMVGFYDDVPLETEFEAGAYRNLIGALSAELGYSEMRYFLSGLGRSHMRESRLSLNYYPGGLGGSLTVLRDETRLRDSSRFRRLALGGRGSFFYRWPRLVYGMLGAEYSISDESMRNLNFSLSTPLGPVWAGFNYDKDYYSGDSRYGISADLPVEWANINITGYGSGSEHGFRIAVSGGLGWFQERNRFETSRYSLGEYGGVVAEVFLDLNRNGRRDPGEPGLEGVRLKLGDGTHLPPSDEDGFVYYYSLPAYKEHVVTVDEATLPDPFYFPAEGPAGFMLRPGKVIEIPVPVVTYGEVTGEVAMKIRDEEEPVSGLDILLIDSDGSEVNRARTEFDGFFCLTGVPAGEYTVKPDSSQFRVFQTHYAGAPLKVEPPQRRIVIPVSEEPEFIDYVDFRVVPEITAVTGTVRIKRDGRLRAASGVDMLLITKTGRSVRNARAGHDGFFCLERVPPGEYLVVPDETSLDELTASLGLRSYSVTPRSREVIIESSGVISGGKDFIIIER